MKEELTYQIVYSIYEMDDGRLVRPIIMIYGEPTPLFDREYPTEIAAVIAISKSERPRGDYVLLARVSWATA